MPECGVPVIVTMCPYCPIFIRSVGVWVAKGMMMDSSFLLAVSPSGWLWGHFWRILGC